MRLTYAGAEKEVSVRKIQSLKLCYKSHAWYVKAYCMEKQDFRIFKLTRMRELEVLEEGFEQKNFPTQQAAAASAVSRVRLCFPQRMSYRVYDEFDKTQIKEQDNGELLVTAELPVDEWLVGYLLSYGAQAEIIEPEALRKRVAEQGRMLYERYKKISIVSDAI